jgi:hypothetical protein
VSPDGAERAVADEETLRISTGKIGEKQRKFEGRKTGPERKQAGNGRFLNTVNSP